MSRRVPKLDVPACVRAFNAGRDPERLALKLARMRATPFVFLRGTCHLFYDRLPARRVLAAAPLVWACGDLHFENFGTYKGDNRLVYFDMNDFDEAALAPATWDLLRFLVSVRVGASSFGATDMEAAALCVVFLDAYAAALADGKARWIERETGQGMIGHLLDSLRARHRSAYLDTRTVRAGRRRQLLADGSKALPAAADDVRRVTDFMAGFAQAQADPRFFKVLDVARRIAGTGSLGVDRYVILVEGRGSPDGNYLLDLKEALPSSLVSHLDIAQPRWRSEAERVVTLQRRVQAVSMAFLQAVSLGRRAYILRGLQPSEDRVALEGWRGKWHRLEGAMRGMAEVVAWGQLRSSGRQGSDMADALIDFGRAAGWRRELLAVVDAMAAQVETDWRVYAEAYDDGYFAA